MKPQPNQQASGQSTSIDYQHWCNVAKRVNDPGTAQIVVDFLDANPQEKAQHTGLYVRALASLQQHRSDVAARAASTMEQERLARQALVQKYLAKVRQSISLCYRCGRLVPRAIRDLSRLLLGAGTVQHRATVFAKGQRSHP